MIFAIASYKGGVGKTTITANLASHLASLGADVHAIDMDDQNALRLHFGVPPADIEGIACKSSIDEWKDVRVGDDSSVSVYPHGNADYAARQAFKDRLRDDPQLLKKWAQNNFSKESIVLIDTPPGGDIFSVQAIYAADIVLVVLNPDGASFATIGAIEDLIGAIRSDLLENKRVFFLLSNYDERRDLDRSVLTVMKDKFEDSISPVVIHYDGGLREALTVQKVIKDYDPTSQANEEFSELAQWLAEKTLMLIENKDNHEG